MITPIYFIDINNSYNINGINYYNQEVFHPVVLNNDINYDFLVSTYGRIYSLKSNGFLQSFLTEDGYIKVNINLKRYLVHRLVMMTFCPIQNPDDFQVNHYDGNKQNNCIWNLYWCTPKENIEHALETGLRNNYGENNVRSMFTNEQVEFMCKCIEEGKSNKEIYDLLNIDIEYIRFRDAINAIRSGKSWIRISSKYEMKLNYDKPRLEMSNDEIHSICKYLSEGKNYDEIYTLMNYPTDDKRYRDIIYSICEKRVHNDISDQYDIIKPILRSPKLTLEQANDIRNYLDQGYKTMEIAKMLGIDTNNLSEKEKGRIYSTISRIRRKETFAQVFDL